MKALVTAGGRGTRLRPLTHSNNKHTLPIANKPMILYPIESILKAGIKEIAIIVNETRGDIEDLLGDGSKFGAKINYIEQDEPRGLGHVLSLSEEFMGDSKFIMVLGDNIIQEPLKPLLDYFEKEKLQGMVLGYKVPESEHSRCGMITVKEDSPDLAATYVEKPGVVENSTLYDPKRSYAGAGFYFFDPVVFGAFKGKDKVKPSSRGEYEISSPYQWLISQGHQVGFQEIKGWWKDPGKPEDLLSANQIILKWKDDFKQQGKIDSNSKVTGSIEYLSGTTISNSEIEGPVVIGKNTKIIDSKIGANVAIADDCVIENVTIENSIIMAGTTIENLDARLKDCIIGSDVDISQDKSNDISLFVGDNSIVRV